MVQPRQFRGEPIKRREDPALLTGEAQYTDDLTEARVAFAAILRSPHGHARVKRIDTSEARSRDGVVGVFTADDVKRAGTSGELPPIWLLPGLKVPPYPMLARDKVRYHGQPVAIVVAESRYVAEDALDLIDVEYEPLPAVTNPEEAAQEGAPTLHDEAPNNIAAEWEAGDKEATDKAFEDAAHIVSIDVVNQRLIPHPMEPRGVLADFRPGTGKLTVVMSTQCPHLHRRFFAEMLDFPENKMRVVAPEVGGGFGSKDSAHPDEAIVIWCAIQLQRPVKWQASRSDSYLADGQGRGHKTHAEMALDSDGNMLALRVRTYGDLGAYVSTFGALNPTYGYAPMLPGQYKIPTLHVRVTETFTNAAPTEPYRGAGRPEASFIIERLADLAARKLNMDPVELRRRNFIPSDAFPYETAGGYVYDSGDYEKTLDKALEMVDYTGLREKQKELRKQGRYLGIGISSYVESCGYGPSRIIGQIGGQMGLWESAVVRFHPSGRLTAYCGTSAHGQGHETTYAQILADELGVPYETIEIVEGDTEEIPMGMGTYGSRSVTVGGAALVMSARKVVDKARKIAAHQLEAAEEDTVFENGEFHVVGAPGRPIHIQEIARQSYLAHNIPDGLEPGLEATSFYDPENLVFPFGAHIAVVEVDPETGKIDLQQYVAVDDCGHQINPKIVEGQVHGAIAQGLGQVLYEEVVYGENGSLISGSLLDYTVPKAIHLPSPQTASTVTPCPHNPLGVKGVGEAGTIAAPQAVVNAVADALAPFGIEHIDMPLRPEKVWRAIRAAEQTA